ncbi:unnamed protein product [Lactuca saligna]|uniref:PI4-kinase N-terminal domain-containing protein n=1 Tax=Lactuca saligna TaxID=75948 RepID=A0AA35ZBL4_LACSI|nr:unnamed protein product [Lactuca saligna]
MLQGTTKLPWKFSHHPAAAGTFFTVMLLGLKFCTCQYEGSLQNVRLGIQLLEDGIYRAALGWFAYEPEWFEHDHGNFAHIEAQSVNSFVHYLQNDPKALGGEYGGSFLDMVRHRYCYLSCCQGRPKGRASWAVAQGNNIPWGIRYCPTLMGITCAKSLIAQKYCSVEMPNRWQQFFSG